jgi:hypothetical protein
VLLAAARRTRKAFAQQLENVPDVIMQQLGRLIDVAGLSHHIIDQNQYSILVAGVIGSAVIPTLVANAFYLPHHLLPETAEGEAEPEPVAARSPPARHG